MAEIAQTMIIVVGLGPGRWEDLTVEAQAILDTASAVIVRTERHPTVETLRQRRPDLALSSFDALYDSADSFADLYPLMARQALDQAETLPLGQALVRRRVPEEVPMSARSTQRKRGLSAPFSFDLVAPYIPL